MERSHPHRSVERREHGPIHDPMRDHDDMTASKRAFAPKRIDGRTRRAIAIKARILGTCRDLMRLGNLQPAAAVVAKAAEVSTKTVFTHFGSIQRLRCNALEDEGT